MLNFVGVERNRGGIYLSKKILYTDLDTLKSVSAQIYKGNLIDNEFTQSESEGTRKQNSKGSSNSQEAIFGARINAIINAGVEGKETVSSYENKDSEDSSLNTYQESKRIAYDEYLINLVEDSLTEQDDLKNLQDVNEFDYLSFSEEFDFYDFNNVNNSLDYKTLIPFIMQENMIMKDFDTLERDMNKLSKATNTEKRDKFNEFQSHLSIKTFNIISNHLNTILSNYFLLINRDNQLIILGNKDLLKLPTIIMSLNKTMKLKVFGMIASKNNLTISNELNELNPEAIFRDIGSFSLENYLIHFFGFDANSEYKIIHPISIEYSAD